MSNLKKSTFSILFFIKRSKLLKNGEAPIFVRVTVNGKSTEFSIKRSILESLWNQSKECSKGKDRNSNELNHYIQTVKSSLLQLQRELEIDGEIVTANRIKEKYISKDACPVTFIDYCEQHIELCRKLIGTRYKETTVKKYGYTLTHLVNFIKHKFKRKDVELFEVNKKFVQDFEIYLMSQYSLVQNSASRHMQNLKKFVYQAINDDLIKNNPFKGFKIKYEETNVTYLTMSELSKLMNTKFDKSLEVPRDIFIFCCCTGMAYCDAKTLSPKHIQKDNGDSIINKKREKTGVEFTVPLIEIPLYIIEKYKNDPYCQENNVVLPMKSNQKMNSYLKIIADICGIKKTLTTHVARHTFATTVTQANNVPIQNVAAMLGHKNLKMTQKYAQVLPHNLIHDMEHVEKQLTGLTNKINKS